MRFHRQAYTSACSRTSYDLHSNSIAMGIPMGLQNLTKNRQVHSTGKSGEDGTSVRVPTTSTPDTIPHTVVSMSRVKEISEFAKELYGTGPERMAADPCPLLNDAIDSAINMDKVLRKLRATEPFGLRIHRSTVSRLAGYWDAVIDTLMKGGTTPLDYRASSRAVHTLVMTFDSSKISDYQMKWFWDARDGIASTERRVRDAYNASIHTVDATSYSDYSDDETDYDV